MSAGRWIAGGLLIAGLVGVVLHGGRRGCAPAPGEPPAPVATPADAAPEPAAGWVRPVADETDPAARGLYRRAIDLAHAGDATGSAAAVDQLRSQFQGSRFAARVAREGDPRVSIALLGAAAAVVVTLMASEELRVDRPPKPPRGKPGPRLPPPGRPLPGNRP
ncbi:MAG: hypothetical protein H6705_05745 [Myxococcales bacterium]|nr:hypothetical protein [Myxococcales bacterium]